MSVLKFPRVCCRELREELRNIVTDENTLYTPNYPSPFSVVTSESGFISDSSETYDPLFGNKRAERVLEHFFTQFKCDVVNSSKYPSELSALLKVQTEALAPVGLVLVASHMNDIKINIQPNVAVNRYCFLIFGRKLVLCICSQLFLTVYLVNKLKVCENGSITPQIKEKAMKFDAFILHNESRQLKFYSKIADNSCREVIKLNRRKALNLSCTYCIQQLQRHALESFSL